MANKVATIDKDAFLTGLGGRPVQTVSWNDKMKNKQEWFKRNLDYFIRVSRFNYTNSFGRDERNIDLYGLYNSEFPEEWFTHVTDPLSAKIPAHKRFPAKIRPVTILRPNIDLLLAEYPHRPFSYQVMNMGDDSYSKYMDDLNNKINQSLAQQYQLTLQQTLISQNLTGESQQMSDQQKQQVLQQIQQQIENTPLPQDLQESQQVSYRDKEAIQGQKWLDRAIMEHHIKDVLLQCFKDWLITGETYTFKSIEYDNIIYKRISPLQIDYDKSPETIFIEDAAWVTYIEFKTVSDIVDEFYDELKEQDQTDLETTAIYTSPEVFSNYLNSTYLTSKNYNKIPVWHVQWKGRKKIGIMDVPNPDTGEVDKMEIDEDYPVQKEDKVEWKWVNEVYEGYRIARDKYIKMRAVPIQRNAMNNFSYCKLQYNGRKFSDIHSRNISILTLGIPFQIMYIIITRALELTIAKSKGKILLIDQNAIPNEGDWDDEKFFYYSEALGYGLLNRNQIGVDKSWNQYSTVDMTLYDSISQLIQLQTWCKQEWDDIVGINRQRKGETYATDAVGVNERAVFQSSTITEMIFNLFDQFVERDLQGLLDYSRFTNLDGVRKLWWDTDLNNILLSINPDTYCSSELGLFLSTSTETMDIKNKLEANVQAMIQNQVRPSAILEILQNKNISDLKAKLKVIEQTMDAQQQQQQEVNQQLQEQEHEWQKEFAAYQSMLNIQYMKAEWAEKKDLANIQGSYNVYSYGKDALDQETSENQAARKLSLEQDKLSQQRVKDAQDFAAKNLKIQSDERIAKMRTTQPQTNIQKSIKRKITKTNNSNIPNTGVVNQTNPKVQQNIGNQNTDNQNTNNQQNSDIDDLQPVSED